MTCFGGKKKWGAVGAGKMERNFIVFISMYYQTCSDTKLGEDRQSCCYQGTEASV